MHNGARVAKASWGANGGICSTASADPFGAAYPRVAKCGIDALVSACGIDASAATAAADSVASAAADSAKFPWPALRHWSRCRKSRTLLPWLLGVAWRQERHWGKWRHCRRCRRMFHGYCWARGSNGGICAHSVHAMNLAKCRSRRSRKWRHLRLCRLTCFLTPGSCPRHRVGRDQGVSPMWRLCLKWRHLHLNRHTRV